MKQEATILYRRRQSDWQTRLFSYVGLPSLSFETYEETPLSLSDVIKADLSDYSKISRLSEGEAVALIRESLDDLSGPELEKAASAFLISVRPKDGKSDLELFNAWVSRRAQPLDPLLINAFARFYICRLNDFIGHLVGAGKKERRHGR